MKNISLKWQSVKKENLKNIYKDFAIKTKEHDSIQT